MAKKTINLEGYTKKDLVWIIQYLAKWNGDLYLERALADLKYQKEEERIAKAEKCSEIANQKRQEYIELLAPYDGKPYCDIPHEILIKADRLAREARAADKKWSRLMGMKGD